uniref:NADPH oxidase 5 n=1 Tax=Varanus komodoensis TaxID=61221 RepID=A0A8D2Q7V2_VARKO
MAASAGTAPENNPADNAEWLRWVSKQFESIAGDDKGIDLEEFKVALKVKESFFAERFFALFDSDGSGTISLGELLKALKLLIYGSETEKLQFLFQVYDVDGKIPKRAVVSPSPGKQASASQLLCCRALGDDSSGSIEKGELRTVLKSCLTESSISLPEQTLDDLTLALFESADADKSGSITFEELRDELEHFPEILENLTISAASWLSPPAAPGPRRVPRRLSPAYWHNHRSELLFLAGYACLNVALFASAALRHARSGPWVPLARACGQCLNFNCAFIVVLMLRRCLTWLRATWVARILPLDQHVALHQLMGYAMAVLAVAHSGAHVANFVRSSRAEDGRSLWEYLLTTRPGIGWVHGTASLTGLALQLLVGLVLLCSSTFVRRSGHFEVFYWTHLSYILIWALLIVHGPNFWKWLVAPGCLFLLEKIVGVLLSHVGGLYIVETNLLPSKVTHLVIGRPPSFHYRPGDYVYLNIPAIAKYEWHPFTISSAPEQSGTIWLHIRSLGQWTSRLYEYFRLHREPTCFHLQRAGSCPPRALPCCLPQCYIDGPYGTCTRGIFTSEHAVLIGAGIGITPFASILQSVMCRFKAAFSSLSCKKLWKVDFIWINRDQKSFEWFISLLTQLEIGQATGDPAGRFLEMHLFMTAALGKNDMKATGLQMALDLLAEREQKDSITGLRTRTQLGRPDWDKKLAEEKKGKVHVFFCGSPALAKVIKAHCERFSFRFFREHF